MNLRSTLPSAVNNTPATPQRRIPAPTAPAHGMLSFFKFGKRRSQNYVAVPSASGASCRSLRPGRAGKGLLGPSNQHNRPCIWEPSYVCIHSPCTGNTNVELADYPSTSTPAAVSAPPVATNSRSNVLAVGKTVRLRSAVSYLPHPEKVRFGLGPGAAMRRLCMQQWCVELRALPALPVRSSRSTTAGRMRTL